MPFRLISARMWVTLLVASMAWAANGQVPPPVPPGSSDTTPPASFFQAPAEETNSLLDDAPGAISDPKLMRLEAYKQPLELLQERPPHQPANGRDGATRRDGYPRGPPLWRRRHPWHHVPHPLWARPGRRHLAGVDYGVTDRLPDRDCPDQGANQQTPRRPK